MQELRDFGDQVDCLEVHPEEYAAPLNILLINVASFFRDPEAWKYLAKRIIPRILGGKTENESVRIWSAACASRQEA